MRNRKEEEKREYVIGFDKGRHKKKTRKGIGGRRESIKCKKKKYRKEWREREGISLIVEE